MADASCSPTTTASAGRPRSGCCANCGIEVDAAAAEKARRFADELHVGDVLTAPFAPAQFDVVTALHVLEHVPDDCSRTFLKLIDEYNYAKHTKGWI